MTSNYVPFQFFPALFLCFISSLAKLLRSLHKMIGLRHVAILRELHQHDKKTGLGLASNMVASQYSTHLSTLERIKCKKRMLKEVDSC